MATPVGDDLGSSDVGMRDVEQDTVDVKNYKDGELVQLTKNLSVPTIEQTKRNTPLTLDERQIDQLNEEAQIQDLLGTMPPETYKQMEAEFDQAETLAENNETQWNFIHQLRFVIATVYAQQGRIHEKDRLEINALKAKYTAAIQEQSSLFNKMGNASLWVAVGCSLLFCASLPVGGKYPGLGKVLEFFSGQDKNVGPLIQNKLQSLMRVKEGESTLNNTLMSQKHAEKQSQSNVQQEAAGALREALEAQKQVVR